MKSKRQIWGITWIAMQLGIIMGYLAGEAVTAIFIPYLGLNRLFLTMLPVYPVLFVICHQVNSFGRSDRTPDDEKEKGKIE